MSNKIDLTRRNILAGASTGIVGALTGCSTVNSNSSSSKGNNNTETDGVDYPTSPNESQYVENGSLIHPPLVSAYRIDELNANSATVEMMIMPNPVGDYEISVNLTPTDEVSTDWEFRTPTNTYFGSNPEYTEEYGWMGENDNVVNLHRVPQEHGERVDTIEVPAEASGTPAENVPKLPEEVMPNPREVSDENMDAFVEWYSNLEAIGDSYDDRYFDDQIQRPEAFDRKPGATRTYFDVNLVTQPFYVELEFDEEIPKHQPFALTFNVHDNNSPDGRPVPAYTGQFIRDDDGFQYPSEFDGRTATTQNFREYYGFVERPAFNNYIDEYDAEGSSPDVGNIVGKEQDYFRVSSYGLYSDTIENVTNEGKSLDETMTVNSNTPYLPVNFIDSPFQNMWSIDVDITNLEKHRAQETAEEIIEDADHSLFALCRSEEIQQHEIVQDVASQLKEVCDNIGATQPTEQVRVVADFVQYMSHVQQGEPLDGTEYIAGENVSPRYLSSGAHHPVWTLYQGLGDCEDYTVLMNTILRTDYFGIETSAAAFENVSILAGSEGLDHVSTAIPIDELEIDSVVDDQHTHLEVDGGNIHEANIYQWTPCTFTYDGTEYAYLEASSPSPIGMIWDAVEFDLPPMHAEEYDYY